MPKKEDVHQVDGAPGYIFVNHTAVLDVYGGKEFQVLQH